MTGSAGICRNSRCPGFANQRLGHQKFPLGLSGQSVHRRRDRSPFRPGLCNIQLPHHQWCPRWQRRNSSGGRHLTKSLRCHRQRPRRQSQTFLRGSCCLYPRLRNRQGYGQDNSSHFIIHRNPLTRNLIQSNQVIIFLISGDTIVNRSHGCK